MQDLFVVIPIQTIGFYNPMYRGIIRKINVVIPIQTIGFYNEKTLINSEKENGLSYLSKRQASTTQRLLSTTPSQLVVIPIQTIGFYNRNEYGIFVFLEVVIPIQTIGFYNALLSVEQIDYDKVVIPIQTIGFYNRKLGPYRLHNRELSYLSKRQASTTRLSRVSSSARVVIPIQTIGFYNEKWVPRPSSISVVIPIQTIGFYN